MRIFLTNTLLALAITTVAALGADNTIGTWKLNLEKSGSYPKSAISVQRVAVAGRSSDKWLR
jgi:hypothetical protein